MPVFEIVQAKRYHCGEIARRLRVEQKEAVIRAGDEAHRRLVQVFDESSWCRAWLADRKLVGLGGIRGPLSSATGEIWLALSADACRFPVEMIKEARRQLREILQVKRQIVTAIAESDSASMRFGLHLGFKKFGEPFDLNGERLVPVSLGK